MQENLLELKRHISQLTDDELVDMVTMKSREYREEALNFAKAEIASRGIDLSEPEAIEEETAPEAIEPLLDSQGRTCPTCKGPLRQGTLIAEKELTIVFADNREERFVKVSACSQCGQLYFAVDYETEVQ